MEVGRFRGGVASMGGFGRSAVVELVVVVQ